MAFLKDADNKRILEYYGKRMPATAKLRRQLANKTLANKLCRCIKKLEGKFGEKSVGICTKMVLGKKGLKRSRFTCKKIEGLKRNV
jgi:hypothetical protein